jgi:hypothetical protein
MKLTRTQYEILVRLTPAERIPLMKAWGFCRTYAYKFQPWKKLNFPEDAMAGGRDPRKREAVAFDYGVHPRTVGRWRQKYGALRRAKSHTGDEKSS